MKFIIGTGGMGREVANYLTDGATIFEFAVQSEFMDREEIDGVVVRSLDQIMPDDECIIAIGDPLVREKIAELLPSLPFFSVIHSSSVISNKAEIGDGAVIAPGVVVSTNCIIGRHCILNYNCTLGHDVELGDFVSVFPGAALSGNVRIGSRVTVGANASVREGVHITSDVTIGMAAVVLTDINEPGVYVGNPLRKIR